MLPNAEVEIIITSAKIIYKYKGYDYPLFCFPFNLPRLKITIVLGIKQTLKRKYMIYKKFKLITVFLLAIGLPELYAQQTIPASGGNASGSGGTVSFTVGQVAYSTNTGTNGLVAQGVQQPYEISVVTGFEPANGITLQLSAYPNPTIDLLNLKIDASALLNFLSLTYQIFDANGKSLEFHEITSVITSINMSGFPMATYYLKISENNTVVKTFKIIKN